MTTTEEALDLARNIINQIGDLWAEKMPDKRWVPMRQATNDELDIWVAGFFRALVAEREAIWDKAWSWGVACSSTGYSKYEVTDNDNPYRAALGVTE